MTLRDDLRTLLGKRSPPPRTLSGAPSVIYPELSPPKKLIGSTKPPFTFRVPLQSGVYSFAAGEEQEEAFSGEGVATLVDLYLNQGLALHIHADGHTVHEFAVDTNSLARGVSGSQQLRIPFRSQLIAHIENSTSGPVTGYAIIQGYYGKQEGSV